MPPVLLIKLLLIYYWFFQNAKITVIIYNMHVKSIYLKCTLNTDKLIISLLLAYCLITFTYEIFDAIFLWENGGL